ncbi:hypothetical protein HY251_18445, partial [bacterium]|nr:hypothetical protein [bacterium]
SPDGRRILATSADRSVRIFDLSGETVDRIDLSSGDDAARACAFVDARSFVVGTERGVVLRFALEE